MEDIDTGCLHALGEEHASIRQELVIVVQKQNVLPLCRHHAGASRLLAPTIALVPDETNACVMGGIALYDGDGPIGGKVIHDDDLQVFQALCK